MSEWQKWRTTVTSNPVGVEAVSGKVANQTEWVELDLNGNLTGGRKPDPLKPAKPPGDRFHRLCFNHQLTSADHLRAFRKLTPVIPLRALGTSVSRWTVKDNPAGMATSAGHSVRSTVTSIGFTPRDSTGAEDDLLMLPWRDVQAQGRAGCTTTSAVHTPELP